MHITHPPPSRNGHRRPVIARKKGSKTGRVEKKTIFLFFANGATWQRGCAHTESFRPNHVSDLASLVQRPRDAGCRFGSAASLERWERFEVLHHASSHSAPFLIGQKGYLASMKPSFFFFRNLPANTCCSLSVHSLPHTHLVFKLVYLQH